MLSHFCTPVASTVYCFCFLHESLRLSRARPVLFNFMSQNVYSRRILHKSVQSAKGKEGSVKKGKKSNIRHGKNNKDILKTFNLRSSIWLLLPLVFMYIFFGPVTFQTHLTSHIRSNFSTETIWTQSLYSIILAFYILMQCHR